MDTASRSLPVLIQSTTESARLSSFFFLLAFLFPRLAVFRRSFKIIGHWLTAVPAILLVGLGKTLSTRYSYFFYIVQH